MTNTNFIEVLGHAAVLLGDAFAVFLDEFLIQHGAARQRKGVVQRLVCG